MYRNNYLVSRSDDDFIYDLKKDYNLIVEISKRKANVVDESIKLYFIDNPANFFYLNENTIKYDLGIFLNENNADKDFIIRDLIKMYKNYHTKIKPDRKKKNHNKYGFCYG